MFCTQRRDLTACVNGVSNHLKKWSFGQIPFMSLSGPMLFWAVDHLWPIAYMAQSVPVSPGSRWQMTRCCLDVLLWLKKHSWYSCDSGKNEILTTTAVFKKKKRKEKKKQCCFYYVSHKTFIVPIVVLCWCLNITTEYAVLANKMSTCWLRSYSCYDEIKNWKHDKHCLLDFITLSLCGANVSSLRINNLNCWELIQRHLSLSKNCNFHLYFTLTSTERTPQKTGHWESSLSWMDNGQQRTVMCPCVIICTYKNSCNRITVKTITNHHCNWLD